MFIVDLTPFNISSSLSSILSNKSNLSSLINNLIIAETDIIESFKYLYTCEFSPPAKTFKLF